MQSTVLPRDAWQARAAAHEERIDTRVGPHLERRRQGIAHPVHDFLFTYYSHRPTALRRWHPGYGVTLVDAPEYAGLKGYERIVRHDFVASEPVSRQERAGLSVSAGHLTSQIPLLESVRRLLVATASRPAVLGCFGLHEWAMVYRSSDNPGDVRHPWPLRLGAAGTDAVVESHRIGCSHFDAFRFFTDAARPLNTLQPGRDNRVELEQPGCLHAAMDLYKHSFRLSPLVPSDLVADAFELAWDVRVLDMRAAPYDLSGLALEPSGERWSPVRIETPEGKAEYVAAQRAFADRAAPIRQRLVDECDRLLAAAATPAI